MGHVAKTRSMLAQIVTHPAPARPQPLGRSAESSSYALTALCAMTRDNNCFSDVTLKEQGTTEKINKWDATQICDICVKHHQGKGK